LKKDWIKIPVKRRANFDQDRTRAKYEKLGELIELALLNRNLKDVERVLDIVKRYRKAGLEQTGEFGPENLAFKAIRKQGLFQKLWDLKQDLHSRELSIEEASGYIPSEKEKNDPRFKTALTVDVKPDSIKKNAKAFGFNTTRAGIPPQAKPNGKF